MSFRYKVWISLPSTKYKNFLHNKVFQQLFYLGFVCFCKLTINLQPFCWIAGRAVFGGSCSITTPCIFLQEELSIWNALWLLSAKCFMLCKWTTSMKNYPILSTQNKSNYLWYGQVNCYSVIIFFFRVLVFVCIMNKTNF